VALHVWSCTPTSTHRFRRHGQSLLHTFFLFCTASSSHILLSLPPLFVRRHCLQLVSVAGPLICNATLPQAVAAAFLTYVSAVHSAALCVAQLFLAFVVTGWRRIVEDMTK